MNSSGIGLLVTLLVRAQRARQRILACGLTEHYREIFELTRLDEVISIHDSEAAALGRSRLTRTRKGNHMSTQPDERAAGPLGCADRSPCNDRRAHQRVRPPSEPRR